ncbi:MAG: YfhO family protein [Candidatus Sumerlaeia bacterium]
MDRENSNVLKQAPPKRLGFWLALAVLAVAPFLFQGNDLIHGRIPFFMDTLGQFYPLRVHAGNLLHSGELPLWNRSYFGGVPFLANPQWGLLYPPHWIMLAFPGPRAYTLINILHIAFMGVGTFLFLRRRLQTGNAGPLLAGLLTQTTGWTWAHLAFGSYLQVAAWFPWMLLCWESARGRMASDKTDKMPWLLPAGLCGICGAMQLLAGAPQLAVYCQGGLFLFVVLEWAMQKLSPLRVPIKAVVFFFALQAVLTLGLAAPQWMTTSAFMEECERTGALPLEKVAQGALDIKGMYHAFFGGTGMPEDAETILYPGLGNMILALLAIPLAVVAFVRKKWADALMVCLALAIIMVSLLLCWKSLTPLWYRILPLYSHFHDPRRILFLAWFFALILAGYSFAKVIGYLGSMRFFKEQRLLSAFLTGLAICCLSVLAYGFGVGAGRIDAKMIPVNEVLKLSAGKMIGEALGNSDASDGSRFFSRDYGIEYSYNYTRPEFFELLMPNVGALYGMEDIQGYDPLIPWRYGAYMRRLNRFPAPSVQLYGSHFGLVRNTDSPWLSRFGKVYAVGPVHYDWPFFPPTRLQPGEQMIVPLRYPFVSTGDELPRLLVKAKSDYSAVGPVGLVRLVGLSDRKKTIGLEYECTPGKDLESNCRMTTQPASSMAAHFFLIENARHNPVQIYSLGLPRPNPLFEQNDKRWHPSTWEEAFPDQLMTYNLPLPRKNERERYENWMLGRSPKYVHIEIPPGDPRLDVSSRILRGWKFTKKESNRLEISLPENHGGGWLVLSEPYFPGWSGHADGKPIPIFVADAMFRALPVPAGTRQITMQYWPPGLTAGLIAFAISLIALGVIVAGSIIQKKKH